LTRIVGVADDSSTSSPAVELSGSTSDENVTSNTAARPVRLLISEVFGNTFQGEGPSTGRHCVFVRTARCNLHCAWCDTPYTWAWTPQLAQRHHSRVVYQKTEETQLLDVDEVVARVTEICAAPTTVVVSGGEPLLQKDGLLALRKPLHLLGHRIEVETAGTRTPGQLAHLIDQWNVSPKLRHSGNEDSLRIQPNNLREFAELDHAHFKFVCRNVDDLWEVARDFVSPYKIPRARVWIMPEGTTPDVILERMRELADPVLEYGWNLTTRLHTLLWGEERGR